ncbi:virulence plasmid b [Fusarium globosum]|uniref:Virulence plasmid b n=1 Tax=Fusarium globosum TaxID=78864 RepID=A0A8H5YBZ5_9HYPO|nr:virulence plasmid b [Fusarium globosum]
MMEYKRLGQLLIEYETVLEDDWQGQALTKSYPNGVRELNKCINNAIENPNKVTSGKPDGQTDFQLIFEYDLQSCTLSHNLGPLGQPPSDTKPLIQEKYI